VPGLSLRPGETEGAPGRPGRAVFVPSGRVRLGQDTLASMRRKLREAPEPGCRVRGRGLSRACSLERSRRRAPAPRHPVGRISTWRPGPVRMPTPFVEDEAFANVVARFADAGGMTKEIVLLGDFMDLVTATTSAGPGDPAVRKLDAIVAAHPRAVAAIADFVSHRHVLRIVPGNHDAALLRRPMQDRLQRRSPVRSVRWRRPPASSSRRGSSTSAAWSTPSSDSSITTSTIPPIFSIAPRPTGGTTAPPPALCLDEWRVGVARTTGVTAAGLLELVAALGRGLRRREPRAVGGCEDGHDHRVPRTIGGRPRARPPSRVRGPPAGPCPRSRPPGRRARCDRSARQATPLSIVHRLAARAGPDDYMLAAARTVHARLRTPAGARCSICSATPHRARPPPRGRGDAPVPQCGDLVDHGSCRTPAGERPPEARRDRARRCPAADGAAAAVRRRRPRGDARGGLTALIDVSR
jgi:hypothetical protein